MCDRTGNVDEIVARDSTSSSGTAAELAVRALVDEGGQDVVMLLGDGKKNKGLKCEWSTVKDGELIVGSTGKERTDDDGNLVHTGEMWVKHITPTTYRVRNVDGTARY